MRALQVVAVLACAYPVTSFNVASREGDTGSLGHVLAAEAVDSVDSVEGAFLTSGKLSDGKKAGVIGGAVLGCLLWCLLPCAIWNNERIAIKQYKIQLKAERWAVHVDDPSKVPLPDMVGRTVYMSGTSTCSEKLTDKIFSKVTSEGKIKLRRVIEMKQWRETEQTDKDGNRTGYTHAEVWADHQLECEASGYQNPRMPFNSTKRQEGYCASASLAAGCGDRCEEAEHKNIKLGVYYLGEFVVRELNRWEAKKLTADQLAAGGRFGSHDGFKGEPKEDPDGWWYWGGRHSGVGAVRVRFEELVPGPTSICGNLAQTDTGYTFLPLRRADSVREGAVAEFGGGLGDCCLRVKELHYDEDIDEKEFQETIKGYPMNLDNKQKKGLARSKTVTDVAASDGEDELGDLCCVGPFGSLVVQLLHWLGLEEEFLGVHEEDVSLKTMMQREGDAAANRHHMCRVASLILLILASLLIISPAIKLLNYHWMISMMGGALISLVLCCGATLLSTATCCCVMSSAWLFYRPILAVFGFAVTGACVFGIWYYIDEQQKHDAGHSGAGGAGKLFLQIAAAVPRAAMAPAL